MALGWQTCAAPPGWPRPLTDLEVAQRWLHCLDCQGSFLERLHQVSSSSRDTVTRFLRSALLNGPDGARRAEFEADLLKTWQTDSTWRVYRGKAPGASFVQFKQRYQDGFKTRWRGRAATALGVLDTPAACSALHDWLQLPLQNKGDTLVRRMVVRALADSGVAAPTPCP